MEKEAIPFDMYATGVVDLQAAASKKVGSGRYSLRKMLGRGGMGIVWLAYDERLQSEVALKFLPPQIRFDPVALDDLRRETARSQKLTHPHIMRIHDLFEGEGEDPFISMEYVDGPSLGALRVQQKERVLSWSLLEPLLRQLCEALEYAHGEGIIHRDLKPANLMMDSAGRLKLADFGIARAVSDTMSRSSIGQTTGTLLYMSPQQLDGGPPRIGDDIYGLGATLYELLTSKPPFFTGDLLHQVRTAAAQPMQDRLREVQLANEIPGHVEDLVMACLDKIESQRPQNAREVAEWLSSGRRPVGTAGVVRSRKARMASLLGKVRGRKEWYVGAAMVLAASGWVLFKCTRTKPALPIAARSRPESNAVKTVSALTAAPPSRLVSSASPAAAKRPTALQLVRQGNTHVSERSRNQVVQILSAREPVDLPPQHWRIVYYDPKVRYKSVEVRFENGVLERIYEPNRLLEFLSPDAQKPLDIEKLRIDSDDALRIALALPVVKELVVRSADFELARGYGGLPVWKIRLFGALVGQSSDDSALGYAIVVADDGKVLKETFSKKQHGSK